MASSRATLERIGGRVPVPQPAFDRLMRRRARKQRNQRIATAVFALILAAAAIGGAIRMLGNAERQVPTNRITKQNVGGLREAWSADTHGQPTALSASDGLVYVSTRGTNELE